MLRFGYYLLCQSKNNLPLNFRMDVKRAAGFLIFRRLDNKTEYLLLRASYGSKHWTPPKGHVDPGEDDFTTALRETQEEAGYTENDLKIYREQTKTLTYKVKGNDKIVIYWLAEVRDPHKDPILSEEHIDFRWLEKDAAIRLSNYNDFAEMVRYFHDQIGGL